jgi:hypothetical protein
MPVRQSVQAGIVTLGSLQMSTHQNSRVGDTAPIDIHCFAQKQRVRVGYNEVHESVIIGEVHIYEYGAGRFGLIFRPDPPRPKLWAKAAQETSRRRFELAQNGDWEGSATFDPSNDQQCIGPEDCRGQTQARCQCGRT